MFRRSLPYSYSRCCLLIHELSMHCQLIAPIWPSVGPLDSGKRVLPLRVTPPLRLSVQTREMSLCGSGYYSAL
eukprot:superscaffoldBa00005676_g20654